MSNLIPLPDHHRTLDLRQALNELEDDQRAVLVARWGIHGGEPLSDDEVAEKFGWDDIEWVWALHDKALQTLGYLWLTESGFPLSATEAA